MSEHQGGSAYRRFAAAALLAVTLETAVSGEATAQAAAGFNPGKDCQVVRTCNFARNGAPRGCLSSYSCRVCRLVSARCTLAGRTRCQELVCSWGG